MYSYGPPHMAVQKQDDQHEHTFSSYVRIRDAVLKTYLGRWTIGRSGERGSGVSVLPARYDYYYYYYYYYAPLTKICPNRWPKDELVSDVLLRTLSYGCRSVGRPARTYLLHLSTDTGCGLEDLSEVMDYTDGRRWRVKEIHVSSMTGWL